MMLKGKSSDSRIPILKKLASLFDMARVVFTAFFIRFSFFQNGYIKSYSILVTPPYILFSLALFPHAI